MTTSSEGRGICRIARALVAAAFALLPPGAAAWGQGPAASGVYSEEQAAKGAAVFRRTCVECHSRKDMANADFRVKWNGRPALSLFEIIRNTMPGGAPGSLPTEEYSAVLAYILKLNGMRSGSATLAADASLSSITLQLDSVPPSGASPSGATPSLSHRTSDDARLLHALRPHAARRTLPDGHGAPGLRARHAGVVRGDR